MSAAVPVGVRRLSHGEGLPLPTYQSEGAAGADLQAAIGEPLTLRPGERVLVPTGLCFEIPVGFELQVRPRSGLASHHGVTVLNAPGTVDCDYRGEVQVLLVNLGAEPFVVARGERIAQAVVAPVSHAAFEERADLGATERGAGGFGSTGR